MRPWRAERACCCLPQPGMRWTEPSSFDQVAREGLFGVSELATSLQFVLGAFRIAKAKMWVTQAVGEDKTRVTRKPSNLGSGLRILGPFHSPSFSFPFSTLPPLKTYSSQAALGKAGHLCSGHFSLYEGACSTVERGRGQACLPSNPPLPPLLLPPSSSSSSSFFLLLLPPPLPLLPPSSSSSFLI